MIRYYDATGHAVDSGLADELFRRMYLNLLRAHRDESYHQSIRDELVSPIFDAVHPAIGGILSSTMVDFTKSL